MPPHTLIKSLDIRLIIADGDLDGLVAGAVLKTAWPDADVVFSHPAEIRSGFLDDIVDENTALCDLPFHPKCGLYIDHHAKGRQYPRKLCSGPRMLTGESVCPEATRLTRWLPEMFQYLG